ncbi:NAD(P)-dependent alcohol dehydrogenase [Rubricoccus marinus]|uniref:Hydroxyacid dehydrogenase n=1 Tax=Rubricoccus marinus TaxID=716817 RepID=A0A259TWK6_9BACT|nr:NAD(P)-dependent alcohol dehydrogenase [Rubricoccus marinus]OZC01928.1 hydroxyacid dehydrogenase [Rubricoccus marinus]
MTVTGYGTADPQTPLAPVQFERPDVRAGEVAIEVTHCGVCHSDVHQCHDDWGNTVWPCVPGHEVVGRVTSVGDGVTAFAEGDIVGVGCMVNSCQTCEPCKAGEEQYCTGPRGATLTYNGPTKPDGTNTYGGYSTDIVCREEFVLRIPDAIDPAEAAPILCAGVTTYAPLRQHKVGKDTRMAVAGVGGLGHMAIQIAKAMGAHVTALTTSPGKTDDIKALGADEVIVMSDIPALGKAQASFELILSTIPYAHDVEAYLNLVAHDGVLHFVGNFIPTTVAFMPMLFQRRTMTGSLIGGVEQTQEVLDFCAEHGIRPEIKTIAMDEINEAFRRVIDEDIRFRHVIDMDTLRKAEPSGATKLDAPVRGLPEDGGNAPEAAKS